MQYYKYNTFKGISINSIDRFTLYWTMYFRESVGPCTTAGTYLKLTLKVVSGGVYGSKALTTAPEISENKTEISVILLKLYRVQNMSQKDGSSSNNLKNRDYLPAKNRKQTALWIAMFTVRIPSVDSLNTSTHSNPNGHQCMKETGY